MLRSSGTYLSSSRGARRAAARAERRKALGSAFRRVRGLFGGLVGGLFDLALLCALPLVYMAASYLALDLPASWATHHASFSGLSFLLWLGTVAVSAVGIARAVQGARPVAPVRPVFARAMLALCWCAALVLTAADLA